MKRSQRLLVGDVVELEFADVGFGGAGEDVEADTCCGDGREDVDLFVTDGLGGGDFLPGFAGPDLDCIFLDVLAVVEPLHGERAVEGDGMRKTDFKGRMMGACRGRPEGVQVAI